MASTAVENASAQICDLGAQSAMREFDHARAQAELALLGRRAEQQPDEQAGEGKDGLVAQPVDERVDLQLEWPQVGVLRGSDQQCRAPLSLR